NPLVHDLKINPRKIGDVVRCNRRQILCRGGDPAGTATVAPPVRQVHAERIAALDLFAARTGKTKSHRTPSAKRRVATQRLAASAADGQYFMIRHPFTHPEDHALDTLRRL